MTSVAAVTSLLLALAGGLAARASGQKPIWTITGGGGDTIFGLPSDVAANVSTGSVFIADQARPGIVELDAATGKLRRIIGRKGDGPGEIRAVGPIGLAPDGSLLGMYDQGRQTLELYAFSGKPVARLRAGMLYYPKGILLLADSVGVLSGGHLVDEQQVASVLFVRRNSETATGPPVSPAMNGRGTAQVVSSLYVAGGPLAPAAGGAYMAEAATGDIWLVTPERSRKLVSGPGVGVPDMAGKFMRRITDQGKEYLRTWFNFPRPRYIERLHDGAFLEAWSDLDDSTLRFYRLEDGKRPRLLRQFGLAVYALTRYDHDSFIFIVNQGGDYLIERVRLKLE